MTHLYYSVVSVCKNHLISKATLLGIYLVMCVPAYTQTDYFQQKVDYDIKATLDTASHTLSGSVEINYTNNSPDELSEIYFHLWTNAYKDKSTALNQQFLSRWKTKLHFAKKSDRGGYDLVRFESSGQELSYSEVDGQIDVVKVQLIKSITPGETRKLKIDFVQRIPVPFSRIGRSESAYQMSQWFPKPAVYDQTGWHPMPYLDLGEFYSEFGDMKVTLTLPSSFVVAATGELINESENKQYKLLAQATKKYIEDKEKATVPKLSYHSVMKTLTWEAKNVHDFAWFANKEFLCQEDKITLESGKSVNTYTFFTPDVINAWQHSITYLNRAVSFYSSQVGEYPYPQATAVYGALDAGGGMEYPMITVINVKSGLEDLDIVITHEVGHNWFYGILASNERDYPWMDEGINSYYEHRYSELYYPEVIKNKGKHYIPRSKNQTFAQSSYLTRYHFNQPLGLHASKYTGINYGTDVYNNTAIMLKVLENQLGTWIFDKAMKTYFQEWRFKHPQPKDIQVVFENVTNRKLDWFFNDLMNYRHDTDYELERVEQKGNEVTLRVRNINGAPNLPFSVTTFKEGQPINTQWFEGVALQKEIKLASIGDVYGINALAWYPEAFREDNFRKSTGERLPKSQFKFVSGIEQPGKVTYYGLPMINYNIYDGWMFGATLHNVNIPGRLFEFMVTPMYATRSRQLVGNAYLQQLFLNPDDNGRWVVGLNLRRYHFDVLQDTKDGYRSYFKVAPSVDFELPSDPVGFIRHSVHYHTNLLFFNKTQLPETIDVRPNSASLKGVSQLSENVLSYTYLNSHPIHSFKWTSGIEHFGFSRGEDQVHKLRWVNHLSSKLKYMNKKSVYLRGWGGVTVVGREDMPADAVGFSPAYFSLFGNGLSNMSGMDGFFFGRAATTGLAGAQMMINANGGFKHSNRDAQFGMSPNYMVALNVSCDVPYLPSIIPIKPYFDWGMGQFLEGNEYKVMGVYSGGLMLDVLNTFRLHLPLINSDYIKQADSQFGRKTVWSRMSFAFDIYRFNPIKFKQNLINLMRF